MYTIHEYNTAVDTILEKVFGSNKIMNISVKSVNIKERKVHASGVARILADGPSTKQLHSLAQLMNYPPPYSSSYNRSIGKNNSVSSGSSVSSGGSSSSSSNSATSSLEQAELISMDFEVCAGMGTKHNGQTVFLKDVTVTLNPDTLLSTVMPIAMTSPIEIDIGE